MTARAGHTQRTVLFVRIETQFTRPNTAKLAQQWRPLYVTSDRLRECWQHAAQSPRRAPARARAQTSTRGKLWKTPSTAAHGVDHPGGHRSGDWCGPRELDDAGHRSLRAGLDSSSGRCACRRTRACRCGRSRAGDDGGLWSRSSPSNRAVNDWQSTRPASREHV